jgi:hypothetical protein
LQFGDQILPIRERAGRCGVRQLFAGPAVEDPTDPTSRGGPVRRIGPLSGRGSQGRMRSPVDLEQLL